METIIILGNSIDSLIWAKKLEMEGEKSVMILDYDLREETQFKKSIQYISPQYAEKITKDISLVKYYKSIYIYPGMYR